jgi:carbamoyl-phosphate synthase large subunit
MPKRSDLNHVLVIGSGPIVIGQACEFDYSGTQACRVLQSEGIRVSLVNSNPATIMTDPEFADATYVEPITPEFVEKVIAAERPDALLATLGGQTALNTAVALHDNGVLEKYNVELIGANIDAIRRGEDRQLFKEIVARAGGQTPRSRVCDSMASVKEAATELGLPVVIGRRSPWAAWDPGWRTPLRSWIRSRGRASRPRPCTRCSSRRACSGGRNTSSS